MNFKKLNYGAVEIFNFNIDQFDSNDINEIKEILLKELVVVIKKQDTNSLNFAKFIHELGTLANWNQMFTDFNGNEIGYLNEYPDIHHWDKNKFFPIQSVTGKKVNGKFNGIFPLGKLDWHCNLNGPDRADGVALQGIKGVKNTRTSWLNTALALKEIPDELYKKIENKFSTFTYNPKKWADIFNIDQLKFMLSKRNTYKMWILQENILGTKGIYLYTNNDCKIDGDNGEIYNELKDFLFQEKFMYRHEWEIGDIVLSDQLLTLHKRRQENDSVFKNRLLNRITFRLSNTGNPPFILTKNKI